MQSGKGKGGGKDQNFANFGNDDGGGDDGGKGGINPNIAMMRSIMKGMKGKGKGG